MDFNADSSWSVAKSSNSRGRTALRPSKEKHRNHVIPATTRYAVTIANVYAFLSNHYEPQEFNDLTSLYTSEQPPEFPSVNNCMSVKGSERNKTVPVNQLSLPRNHHLKKSNIQEPKKNEISDIFHSNHSEL